MPARGTPWVKPCVPLRLWGCAARKPAEPRSGADALQLTLVPRFSCWARLTASVPPALRAAGTAGMGCAPSVASLGAERLANHGKELRTPLITAPAGRYQGAPALIPAISASGS
jgi:hypothetical protein